MSRRKPSHADTLIMLPWQISAALAVAAFVGLRWVLPTIVFENSFFSSLAKVASGLSWFALIGFGVIAGLSKLIAAKKRALLDGQRDLESLGALSWQQFEWMVGEAYRRQGYSVEESLAGGADGGIDLILRKDGQTSLMQCKRWKTQSVGAPVIREMFGLLAHHRADRVIVVTSGQFTREALAFADGKSIDLINGPALLALVRSVRHLTSLKPLKTTSIQPGATATPVQRDDPEGIVDVNCPSCGVSMVKRTAKHGANAGNTFWGCSNYPTCRGVRQV